MSSSFDGYRFDDRGYDRPNDDWVCGWSREGRPCPIGPTARGGCQAEQICVPYRKGDRWQCNRPADWGGKCQDGPLPDGSCSHPFPRCQPVRSLTARRRGLTFAVTVLTLGALLVALGGDRADSVINPGALASPHGHLEENCSACHASAEGNVGDWAAIAWQGGAGLADSGLCLDCHPLGEHALAAHSLPPEDLAAVTRRIAASAGPDEASLADLFADFVPEVPQTADGELACATCHQEHHGRNVDLTRLSNRQCQTCHASTFHSFSEGHPEFGAYPHERRTRLHFDHATHYGRHFAVFERLMPNGIPPTSCSTCHTPDAAGQTMLVRGFEETCAACHATQIEDDALPGVPFVRLPGVDVAALRAAGHDVGEWPAEARGGITPFLELLLATDEAYLAAQRILGDVSPADLDDADAAELEAAATIVRSVKRLLHDLVTRREEALDERLATALAGTVAPARLAAFTGRACHGASFFDALTAAQEQWLPTLNDELAGTRVAEDEDSTEESTSEDASSEVTTPTPDREIAFGDWSLDAADYALRFRPGGHADPLLSRWIEVAAQRNPVSGTSAETRERSLARLLDQLTDPEAAGRCMKCHTIDRTAAGLDVNWYAARPSGTLREFTRFSHAPHLTLLGGAESCGECHVVSESMDLVHPEFFHPDWSLNTDPASDLTSGLEPLARQSCVACHTSDAAGDDCLSCHNYHVGERPPHAAGLRWLDPRELTFSR